MRIHLTCGRGWTFTLRPAAPPWVAELCSCLSWLDILLVKQHYYHQHKHLDQNMNTFCVQRNILFVRKPIVFIYPARTAPPIPLSLFWHSPSGVVLSEPSLIIALLPCQSLRH